MKNNLRILVVDDEKSIRRFLKGILSSHGYQIAEAKNGEEAIETFISFRPDLVILDLGLPDIDGVKVASAIRKRKHVPILILSVREQEADKIAALDAGADDYLTKPFKSGELLARLRALMRRLLPQVEGKVFKTGELSVDFGQRIILVKGEQVRLTPTEYDVLKILVTQSGKVVTHGQLFKEVWGKSEDVEGISHLLRVTIGNLRNKIEPDADRPSYIMTESGIGYRLRSES